MGKWSETFQVEEYAGDSGTWSRIDWGALVRDQLKGLVALVTGFGAVMVSNATGFFTGIYGRVAEFVESVTSSLFTTPASAIEGALTATEQYVTTAGPAGQLVAIVVVMASIGAVYLSLRIILRAAARWTSFR